MEWGQRKSRFEVAPILIGSTANPAAGADYANIVVPAGRAYLMIAFSGSLVTAVAAANRYPRMTMLGDGTNITSRYMGSTPQTASLTCQTTWAAGATYLYLGGYAHNIPLPNDGIELEAAAVIQFSTVSIQAADDWGIGRYSYKDVQA